MYLVYTIKAECVTTKAKQEIITGFLADEFFKKKEEITPNTIINVIPNPILKYLFSRNGLSHSVVTKATLFNANYMVSSDSVRIPKSVPSTK